VACAASAHAMDPYALFLLGIENPKPNEPRKAIQRPSQLLVQACICHMSDVKVTRCKLESKTGQMPSTLYVDVLGPVSGTLREFRISTGLETDAPTLKIVDHLRESNDPRRAPAFSLEEALPKLVHALFTLNTFPTWSKKVRVWARSLVTIDLTARSSDVTYYCPKLENMNSLMTQWILHLMACPTFYRLALMTGRVGPHGRRPTSSPNTGLDSTVIQKN
jgi:hypothetical protein